jgi:hypothetical protein
MKCMRHQVLTPTRAESLSGLLISRRHVDLMRVVSAACR